MAATTTAANPTAASARRARASTAFSVPDASARARSPSTAGGVPRPPRGGQGWLREGAGGRRRGRDGRDSRQPDPRRIDEAREASGALDLHVGLVADVQPGGGQQLPA